MIICFPLTDGCACSVEDYLMRQWFILSTLFCSDARKEDFVPDGLLFVLRARWKIYPVKICVPIHFCYWSSFLFSARCWLCTNCETSTRIHIRSNRRPGTSAHPGSTAPKRSWGRNSYAFTVGLRQSVSRSVCRSGSVQTVARCMQFRDLGDHDGGSFLSVSFGCTRHDHSDGSLICDSSRNSACRKNYQLKCSVTTKNVRFFPVDREST